MTIQLGILIQQTSQRTMTLCVVEGRTQCNLKERNMRKNVADVLSGEHRHDTQARGCCPATEGNSPQCKLPGMEGWVKTRWWKWECCWSEGTSHLPCYPDLMERLQLVLQLEERHRTEGWSVVLTSAVCLKKDRLGTPPDSRMSSRSKSSYRNSFSSKSGSWEESI